MATELEQTDAAMWAGLLKQLDFPLPETGSLPLEALETTYQALFATFERYETKLRERGEDPLGPLPAAK